MGRKYKLLKKENIAYLSAKNGTQLAILRRVKALRDIPSRGVKRGDIGGYVSSGNTLSHKGDSWIANNAIAVNSTIEDNGFVRDQAVIVDSSIRDNASVTENANIISSSLSTRAKAMDDSYVYKSSIRGNAVVRENGQVNNSTLSYNSLIMGEACLHDVHTSGFVTIGGMSHLDDVKINQDTPTAGDIIRTVRITGSTTLEEVSIENDSYFSGNAVAINSVFYSKTTMKDKAEIRNSTIHGDLFMSGKCFANRILSSGSLMMTDNVTIKNGATFDGKNDINGDSDIIRGKYENISRDHPIQSLKDPNDIDDLNPFYIIEEDATVLTKEVMPQLNTLEKLPPVESMSPWKAVDTMTTESSLRSTEPPLIAPHIPKAYTDLISEIEASYEAYTTDVTKLIVYPAMVDMTVVEVCDFVMALKTIKRKVAVKDVTGVESSIDNLDRLFVIAENKARTLSTSLLDENKKKRLKTAKDAFSIALDTEVNEHERVAGYKSGLSNLDGVIDVSTDAIKSLKAKIGLKELMV